LAWPTAPGGHLLTVLARTVEVVIAGRHEQCGRRGNAVEIGVHHDDLAVDRDRARDVEQVAGHRDGVVLVGDTRKPIERG
jgi:hypothetical protein